MAHCVGISEIAAHVLCHCDFKVSNLHVTPADELVVLDWEFAWAGPRLIDIGQLLRWHPPESFVHAAPICVWSCPALVSDYLVM